MRTRRWFGERSSVDDVRTERWPSARKVFAAPRSANIHGRFTAVLLSLVAASRLGSFVPTPGLSETLCKRCGLTAVG